MPPKTPDMTGRPDTVLDIERLKKNCNYNQKIVVELLRHLYQTSGPKWILALEQGIQNGNGEELREVCHGMKGACATVFAWRLSNIAFEFEYLARDGEITTLKSRMGELRQRFIEIEKWIKENL